MKRAMLLVLAISMATLSAGQLDLAVIRFGETKDPAAISSALARVQLAKVTDADRTRTREEALKNGTVLFTQSLTLPPTASFSSVTRLGNSRSDVQGSLSAGVLGVQISLSEGVASGVRNFEKRNYAGKASLPSGPATVISIRETRATGPSVVRGQSKMKTTTFTTVLAAQYTP